MSNQEYPEPNKQLLADVVNHIIEHPEEHNQETWHCGTTHCFAGWGQIMGGREMNDDTASKDAKELFGLTDSEAGYLFNPYRSIVEIHDAVSSIIYPNRAGFDRAGFDRDGFDRDGFDRDGFDRAGFNRDGFGRAGFDRAGFDRDGFGRAGFDRAGFNRAGFNRDGFNRDGNKLPLITLK